MQHQHLWDKIRAFQMDIHDASFPFTARLARDNGWTNDYAARVVLEYKKFIFLCCVAGYQVTPSDEVDQAWHLHLVYSRSYWNDLCRDTIGRPIHHGPTKGGNAERAKYKDNYANTLESYRKHFESEPPADIWPTGKQRFSEINFTRVNTHRNWVVPKGVLPIHPVAAVVIVLLLFLLPFIIFSFSKYGPEIIACLFAITFGVIMIRLISYQIKSGVWRPSLIYKRVKERKELGKDTPLFHRSMLGGLVPAFIIMMVVLSWTKIVLLGMLAVLFVMAFFWYNGMAGMYLTKRSGNKEQNNNSLESGCTVWLDDIYEDPSDYDGGAGSGCSGDSGCGGDSGCSGCGGCGGCGGCS